MGLVAFPTLEQRLRVIAMPLETPANLVEFVRIFAQRLSVRDEHLFLHRALTARWELWQERSVLAVVRDQPFANENVRLMLDLLTCNSLTEEVRQGLERLVGAARPHLLNANLLAHLLTGLHLRGIIDGPQLLLPKLRWYSRTRLWENAVEVLSVCAPHLLKEPRLRRLASIRSKRCRWLLQFYPTEASTSRSRRAYEPLRKAAVALSRFGDERHGVAVYDLGRICLHREPDLACNMARELVVLRDFRDLEAFAHFLYQSSEASDLETLAAIANGPNNRAARLAKPLLEKRRKSKGGQVLS